MLLRQAAVCEKQYSNLLTILFKLIQHFNSFTSRYPCQFRYNC